MGRKDSRSYQPTAIGIVDSNQATVDSIDVLRFCGNGKSSTSICSSAWKWKDHVSGQITIYIYICICPKPGGIPLLNHHLG